MNNTAGRQASRHLAERSKEWTNVCHIRPFSTNEGPQRIRDGKSVGREREGEGGRGVGKRKGGAASSYFISTIDTQGRQNQRNKKWAAGGTGSIWSSTRSCGADWFGSLIFIEGKGTEKRMEVSLASTEVASMEVGFFRR